MKIPYSQMIMGLDALFFGGELKNDQDALERADTIDAYLEGCGYTWDDVLEGMCHEEDSVFDPISGSRENVRHDLPRGRS